MKRRNFLIGAGLTTAAIACKNNTPSSSIQSNKIFKWKCALAVPKTLKIWGPALLKFAKLVDKMSNGRLKIKVFGGSELVPPLQIFDAVKDGTVEMGHAAAYYWNGKIPASVFFTAIPFGMNAQGMSAWISGADGQKLWDELYADHGVKALPCGNTGMQMGGWFRKEINTLADFKGLKMRMPGLGGKVITKLGASAVNYPAQEIITNLTTGVIDATEWVGPFHDYIMGFHKAAKYYYSIGWHEPGSVLELLINKKAWDSLPEDLQLIVKSATAYVDRIMFSEWMAKDSEYYQRIKNEGKIIVKKFPKEVILGLKEKSKEVILEVRNTSSLAKRIHDSFYQFKNKFDAYQNINERSYYPYA